MGLNLKNNKKIIPAGVPFTDERTGRVFDAYQMGLRETVKAIIQHRSSNPTFYPSGDAKWFDVVEVRQEVLREVYKKRPDLFVGFNASSSPQRVMVSASKPAAPSTCQCGSTEFDPVYCPTCSGRRVTGFKCQNCGKVSKK